MSELKFDSLCTGSDEEAALVKAVCVAFSNTSHLFCILHCEDNVRDHVTKTGIEQSIKLGMLNDYRIFDYQIKCSFSFSFVSHSILEILHKFVHFIRRHEIRGHACCPRSEGAVSRPVGRSLCDLWDGRN